MNKKVILITGASSGMGKDTAKALIQNILLSTDQQISGIAYSLGFEYPQYFS